ncbi:SDR family NAD(P)-dependent oxidoreductase [Actinomadura barringtoniae]|uniref:SDR family NAD(P)-dependent oxidoreductase n=1 Tax=Actinomadura barringtoniae TaxID=1427535 RepID=A0A939T330_9ACTN|nr:SDR family NAD(P)-dependent oxidoreductase [Actinomadura barringtoniae]MBO2447488.1 SDR family NAD(P)-dependent oxidoreductase [Actinomadura barringtoniae]
MTTIAVFGTGPGLGLSTARRFGREGFDVTLIARSSDRLGRWRDELAAEGITVTAVTADLADRDHHAELLGRVGPVDVAVFSNLIDHELIRPMADVDEANLAEILDGALVTPLSLIRPVLAGMRERGTGTLLFGLGASAKVPMSALGGYGIAGAGLRNYLLTMNAELSAANVHVAMLTIGVLIERSDAARFFDADAAAGRGLTPPRRDPDELAELYWELHTKRDRAEIDVF